MARIKVFDNNTQTWVYADKSFGKDGKTPVKGVDYFTDADKEEFLNDIDAVRYVEQALTEEQKAQARKNIGVPDSGGNVAYDKAQNLTDAQKTQARKNIGAASEKKISLADYLNSIHCPVQLPANNETDSDFNLHTFADFGNGLHSYFDDLVKRYPHYLVRELMGKDSSNTIDMYRYVLGKHYWSAWYKENYPRMYAWKNGNTVIYSESVAPRIGDNMYVAPVIGEKYGSQAGTENEIVTVPGKAVIIPGYRYSHSGQSWIQEEDAATLVFPVSHTLVPSTNNYTRPVLTLTNAVRDSYYSGYYQGTTLTGFPGKGASLWSENYDSVTLTTEGSAYSGDIYGMIFLERHNSETFENTSVSIDGVPLDIIVTYNTEDVSLVVHATTRTETDNVKIPAKVVIIKGQRYSQSAGGWIAAADTAALVIPTEFYYDSNAGTGHKISVEITNAGWSAAYDGVYIGDSATTFPRGGALTRNGNVAMLGASGAIDFGKTYSHICLAWDGSSTMENVTITVDGEPVDVIVTTNTEDATKATYAITKEVETETEAVSAVVTAVSATNRSRTINGLEFIRYEDGDVEPTLYYTAAYNPDKHLVDINEKWENGQFTIEGNVLTGYDAKPLRYIRYPFGDLTKDKQPLIHMTIITNEHGGDGEPGIPTVVAARLIRDLCNGQCSSDNPLYRYLRDKVQITFIPGVNPHGLNKYASGMWDGYYNANNVNINRNYDTPGWDYCYNNQDIDGNDALGPYPGSENETQYVMNTMVDSKADVAMSVHTLSCNAKSQRTRCMY